MMIVQKYIPISVIVPVYNVQSYLLDALCSIASQTWQEFECILIDDGSTDESGKICDDFAALDRRFHVIHQENKGLSAARNTGMSHAFGEYIAFVDSDDKIADDMLEKMYIRAKQDDLDIVCGNVSAFDSVNNSKSDRKQLHSFCGPGEIVNWNTLSGKSFQQAYFNVSVCNKLFKRELLNQFCFLEGKKFEDVIFWSNIFFCARKIGCIQETIYFYRVNRQNSITGQGNFSEYPVAWKEQFNALVKHNIWQREKGNFIARINLKFLQAYNRSSHKNKKIIWKRSKQLFFDFGKWEYASDFSLFVNMFTKTFFCITKCFPFPVFRIVMIPLSILSYPRIHFVLRRFFVNDK